MIDGIAREDCRGEILTNRACRKNSKAYSLRWRKSIGGGLSSVTISAKWCKFDFSLFESRASNRCLFWERCHANKSSTTAKATGSVAPCSDLQASSWHDVVRTGRTPKTYHGSNIPGIDLEVPLHPQQHFWGSVTIRLDVLLVRG